MQKKGHPAPLDPNGRYRVLDYHEGESGQVWGEDLSLTEAQKLKESVTGSGKSRFAAIHPMDGDVTPKKPELPGAPAANDAYLEQVRRQALGAASGAAAEAQKRADLFAANQAKIAAATQPLTSVPGIDDLPGADDVELPSEEEFAQAKAEAEAMHAAALAIECETCKALPGRICEEVASEPLNAVGFHDARWFTANPSEGNVGQVYGDDPEGSVSL